MQSTRSGRLIGSLALLLVAPPASQNLGEASQRLHGMQARAQMTTAAAPAMPDPTAGVEVTILPLTALATKFCALGPKAYVIYLPLDVTVANGRRTPIILTRYLHVQRVLIGRSSEDVLAHKYELATPPRPYQTLKDVTFGPVPSDDGFVVLKHNETYEWTAVESIPVRNDPAAKVPGTSTPGSLALSIEVQTWPFARDAGSWQKTWATVGDLISAPVLSYPALVKLPTNPSTENCGPLAP